MHMVQKSSGLIDGHYRVGVTRPREGLEDPDVKDELDLVGRDHLDPVGRDLALLAACNHTIVSQGMFGPWGAFLAGGDMFTKYGVLVQHVLS